MATNMNEKRWHDGYPKIVPAYYDCLVDGEERTLRCYYCEMQMKYRWLDPTTQLYVDEPVKWTGKPRRKP